MAEQLGKMEEHPMISKLNHKNGETFGQAYFS